MNEIAPERVDIILKGLVEGNQLRVTKDRDGKKVIRAYAEENARGALSSVGITLTEIGAGEILAMSIGSNRSYCNHRFKYRIDLDSLNKKCSSPEAAQAILMDTRELERALF